MMLTLGYVPLAKFVQRGALLTIALQHRYLIAAVEAGEMIETQWLPINQYASVKAARGLPVREIPGRDVKRRRTQNSHVIKKAGRQIHPQIGRAHV